MLISISALRIIRLKELERTMRFPLLLVSFLGSVVLIATMMESVVAQSALYVSRVEEIEEFLDDFEKENSDAEFFAENYWTFVNHERDKEFLNIYEVESMDSDPLLICHEP